jgi:PAS domain S-box-containing protein
MPFRSSNLSIRSLIFLMMLGILVPAGGALAWLLAIGIEDARTQAMAGVQFLARERAAELQRVLQDAEATLSRIAERPLIRGMDSRHCDPVIEEFSHLAPEYVGLAVRDLEGNTVCSFLPDALPATAGPSPAWLAAALQRDGFDVSPFYVGQRTGRKVVAMTYPIRDASRRTIGLVMLPVDLQALSTRLLASDATDTLVSVVDSSQTVLLRSEEAERYIGSLPASGVQKAGATMGKGFFQTTSSDGVERLFAVVTIPGVEWRVVAGRPVAIVFAEYQAVLARSALIAAAVLFIALVMGRRLNATLVRPILQLQRVAVRVGAGDTELRAHAIGPPELRAVAAEINRMLDTQAVARARLQAIFDSTSEAILTVDESQTIIMANRAATRAFGHPIGHLLGAPLALLIPARHRAAHGEALRQFGAVASPARSMGTRPQLFGLHADGHEFPIEASISHMRASGQQLFTVLLRDVTAKQKAEEDLRASKAMLDTALASMHDAVFIVDLEGRFLEINQAFARFHRYRSKADCARTLADYAAVVEVALPGGEPAPIAQWPAPRAFAGESDSDVEFRLCRKDTGERWIGSFSFAPLRSEDGRVTAAVVTARDITDLRLSQQALEASHADLQGLIAAVDRIQESERGRISRELHDDLQQTLTAIEMEAAAAAIIFESDSAHAQTAAGMAALARVGELASAALLSTRRIVNDLRPQVLEELGLRAALEALATDFSRRHGVACSVIAEGAAEEADLPDGPVVTCFYRVAQEALNNVAKHAEARSVLIALGRIEDDDVWLRIVDDGCGMAPSDRAKTSRFGLLGMIERLHALGGTLRISATPPHGTTLEARLPEAACRAVERGTSGSPAQAERVDMAADRRRRPRGVPRRA